MLWPKKPKIHVDNIKSTTAAEKMQKNNKTMFTVLLAIFSA